MTKNKALGVLNSICIAVSPSQHPKYPISGVLRNSSIQVRKKRPENKETEYDEASLQQKADPNTPTNIERVRDTGNQYRME